MKIAPVAEVKARFSAYLKRCEDGPVIITQNGRPVAVLIAALEEEELERLVLAYTPKFRGLLDAARARIEQTGGVRHEDFWQSVEAAGAPSGDH
ncbi:MAG: type II toxin-antitoxin system Phd/YefM family antitoxin [Anaerolineae bacterium]|nr:type II toxin-antitoxin system Phd/YefM family antitoxin [Anaerolineae bacterium]